MNRRSFLAALSCLPFVGKFVPQEPKWFVAYDLAPQPQPTGWAHSYPTAKPFSEYVWPKPCEHDFSEWGEWRVFPDGDQQRNRFCTHCTATEMELVTRIRTERPRLTFAEWDRQHQA